MDLVKVFTETTLHSYVALLVMVCWAQKPARIEAFCRPWAFYLIYSNSPSKFRQSCLDDYIMQTYPVPPLLLNKIVGYAQEYPVIKSRDQRIYNIEWQSMLKMMITPFLKKWLKHIKTLCVGTHWLGPTQDSLADRAGRFRPGWPGWEVVAQHSS